MTMPAMWTSTCISLLASMCTHAIRIQQSPEPRVMREPSSVFLRCMFTPGCFPAAKCDDKGGVSHVGGGWHTCTSRLPQKDCLAYSVGIAKEPYYDISLGQLGCDVHSFDPTEDYEEIPLENPVSEADKALHRLGPNVSFYKWGLRGDKLDESTAVKFGGAKGAGYRGIEGEMLDLSTIMQRLGHAGRKLDVLKMDCEGCEWEVLNSLAGSGLELPDQLVLELHFQKSAAAGEPGVQKIRNGIAFLWKHGYRPVYMKPSGTGLEDAEMDRTVYDMVPLPPMPSGHLEDAMRNILLGRQDFPVVNNKVLEVSLVRLAHPKDLICTEGNGQTSKFKDIRCVESTSA